MNSGQPKLSSDMQVVWAMVGTVSIGVLSLFTMTYFSCMSKDRREVKSLIEAPLLVI